MILGHQGEFLGISYYLLYAKQGDGEGPGHRKKNDPKELLSGDKVLVTRQISKTENRDFQLPVIQICH